MPINFFKHIAALNDGNVIRIIPPAELREFVEGYYILKKGTTNGRQLFFNDGYPVIAFMENADQTLKINIAGQPDHLGNMWVCGGMLNNIYCESLAGFDNLLVVRLYPLTFFKLFGVSNTCFEQKQIFNLSDLIDTCLTSFSKSLYNIPVIEDRVQVISSFISQKADQHALPGVLTDILDVIEKQGILSVKDLLNKYMGRLNYKWLERNFKTHIGISPKNYFLRKRFLSAYQDLDNYTAVDLLKVALDNGYYDDNHLIKDFKRFSGCSPKKYFRSITPAV